MNERLQRVARQKGMVAVLVLRSNVYVQLVTIHTGNAEIAVDSRVEGTVIAMQQNPLGPISVQGSPKYIHGSLSGQIN